MREKNHTKKVGKTGYPKSIQLDHLFFKVPAVIALVLLLSLSVSSQSEIQNRGFLSAEEIANFMGLTVEEVIEQLNAAIRSEEESLPPILVEITNASFDESSRILTVSGTLTNTKEVFQDNLIYALQLFRGERLSTEGNVFGGLEYVLSDEGNLNPLGPREKSSFEIQYSVSPQITSDNYFIKIDVLDDQYNGYGLDYTKTPTQLTGSNSFVIQLGGHVRTIYGETFFMGGPNITMDDTLSVILPLSKNTELAERITSGETYYIQGTAFTPDFDKELVYEYPKEELEIVDDKGTDVLMYPVKPWVGAKPGPYTLELMVYDENENPVMLEPAGVRLLIEGLTTRIYSAKTGKNEYKMGDSLSLNVLLTLWNPGEPKDALLEVSLKDRVDGKVFKAEKEIQIISGDIEYDFSDITVPYAIDVASVSIILRDSATSAVLHEYSIEPKYTTPPAPTTLSTVKSDEYPKEDLKERNKLFYAILAALAVIAISYATLKRRGGVNA